ncbi:helix-turn-helix domain-containing protein [Parabacteroides pacaensis]|uniref:helix-turn-helix domain-containing protein n=1 Tax=Parabacteroides pacaensis TaxID=2086575 RepID=UPI000D0F79F5|nr:helix-turn-helix domain-containing protein [Parabacteroides pacaensis]
MITVNEPNVAATNRYSVMQACEILGVHRNTLRNYTNQGLIKCGYRKTTARKFYTGAELLRFWRASL